MYTVHMDIPKVVRLRRTNGMIYTGVNEDGIFMYKGVAHPELEAVYIGRKISMGGWNLKDTIYGNPYSVKKYGIHDAMIAYFDYVHYQKGLVDNIKQNLAGKIKMCWCKDNDAKLCHGDILHMISDNIVSSSLYELLNKYGRIISDKESIAYELNSELNSELSSELNSEGMPKIYVVV